MADNVTLAAELREGTGKGAARAIRREGRVPAVIYGDKQDPITISLGYTEVLKQVNTGLFMTRLVDVEVDGKKIRTIPRDVQFEPVRDFIMHVDFLRLGKGATVNVEIPVVFVNEADSPGLKRGGVLTLVRPEVELVVTAGDIPEKITVDLSGLNIGDTVTISSVDLPAGAKPTIDRDFVIANISAPSGLRSSDNEGEGEGDAEATEAEATEE